MRALIVDPDAARRTALETELLRHGYEIEARAQAPTEAGGFDLVCLGGDDALAARVFGVLRDEHDRARDAVLEIVEARELLDRHPVLQQSIRLRNPYVDPMNAIQVELLKRWRAGDESALRPLLRSIAGIAAALRNTG